MSGDFSARIAELRRMIGSPQTLTGTCVVDQRYAHYQHERLDLRHPRGGEAKYLERPLFDQYRTYLQDYASTVLTDGGRGAFKRSMDHLSDQVAVHAPVEFTHLRRSGHPIVTLGTTVIHDREPEVHRLTETELRALNRERWKTMPDALKGWIYWNRTVRGRSGLPPLRKKRGFRD
jgi:hypothetical protein